MLLLRRHPAEAALRTSGVWRQPRRKSEPRWWLRINRVRQAQRDRRVASRRVRRSRPVARRALHASQPAAARSRPDVSPLLRALGRLQRRRRAAASPLQRGQRVPRRRRHAGGSRQRRKPLAVRVRPPRLRLAALARPRRRPHAPHPAVAALPVVVRSRQDASPRAAASFVSNAMMGRPCGAALFRVTITR